MIIASNLLVAYNFLSIMSEPLNGHLRVFLCHSSKDQSIARELYRELNSEKWMDVWFIEANLLPSQDWATEIKRAVRSSDVLIFLYSKNSIEKEEASYPNITFVLDILQEKSKRLIPIIILRLDDYLLPTGRNKTQVIDYFPKYQRKSAFQSLIDSLKFHAKQLHISLNNELTQTEPDQFLQWSPSNWRNLAFNNEADALDDLPSSSQKMERGMFDRTNKIGVILWTIIGLLTLLFIWLVKNHLAMDDSAVTTLLPLPAPTLGIGSVSISPNDGMKMLYVPAGEFIMGGDVYYDEKPIHTVNLNAFWIDQTEVTNAMFAEFLTEEGNREEGGVPWLDSQDEDTQIHLQEDSWQADQGFENYPVIEVTWYGANAYCSWAGRRLPTEAEWEKVARGTNGNIYPWGNDAPNPDLLNFNDNIGATTKTGSYPNGASPYGALDMTGNVWEWVADRHSRTYYTNSPVDNPVGPETGFFRVLRGGAWNYRDTYARTIHRHRGVPIISHDFIGFRCAIDAFH
ncbi:MAG: SUMF1/EgtB/PvdO family nonheme iron enzyme [Anaerolineae bacterium]|nr:SUMF1/EgtB/PvdO family nonheme iron enzyme [Anaerolineae bacterium]